VFVSIGRGTGSGSVDLEDVQPMTFSGSGVSKVMMVVDMGRVAMCTRVLRSKREQR